MRHRTSFWGNWFSFVLLVCSAVLASGLLNGRAGASQRSTSTPPQATSQVSPTNTLVPATPGSVNSASPTATSTVSYHKLIRPEESFNPEYKSCRYGYVNGNVLSICAGRERFGGDSDQGIVRIIEFEPNNITSIHKEVYETPEKAGIVHIVAANGSSVKVASEDGKHVFTFDIALRLWLAPAATPPIPSDPYEALAGIYKYGPGMNFAGADYGSAWHDVVNGDTITVEAGGYKEYPQQGLLWVETGSASPELRLQTGRSEIYDTPLLAGWVRIVAANGLRLTLHADNGQQFIFDLATRQWLPPAPGQTIYPTLGPRPTSVCSEYELYWGPGATCVAQVRQTAVVQSTMLALTPTNTPQPPTGTLTPVPSTLPAVGIVSDPDPSWPTSTYIFDNMWRELGPSGVYLTAYAGAYRKDHGQGLVFVMARKPLTFNIDLEYSDATYAKNKVWGQFLSPLRAGPLRIVGANGKRLDIVSTHGDRFIFDVAALSWVSPTTAVPSAVPTR